MPILVPDPLSPMTPNTFSQQYSETPNFDLLSNEALVRRNSLSLRSPPRGSVASEILNTPENEYYLKAKGILSNLKEMADKYSDFASCESFSDDTDASTSQLKEDDGFQTQRRKKNKNKRKQKFSPSPSKEPFVKRQNKSNSPELHGNVNPN